MSVCWRVVVINRVYNIYIDRSTTNNHTCTRAINGAATRWLAIGRPGPLTSPVNPPHYRALSNVSDLQQ